MKTINLTILGMDCAACASTLERVMNRQKGVSRAVVNYTAASMELGYDDAALTLEDVVLFVKKAGFRVPMEEADLALSEGADRDAVKAALRTVYGVCDAADRPDRKLRPGRFVFFDQSSPGCCFSQRLRARTRRSRISAPGRNTTSSTRECACCERWSPPPRSPRR